MSGSLAVRRFSPVPPYGVAATAAAFAAGILIAVRPVLGVAAVGALCFALLVWVSVPAGIAVLIPALFVAYGIATTGMLIVLAAAWVGCLIARPATVREMLPGQRFVVGALALLLAWLALSLFWTKDSARTSHMLGVWFSAGVVLILVATTVVTPAQVRLLLAAFVFGAVLSVVIGVLGLGVQEVVVPGSLLSHSSTNRFSGAEGNPNDLALQLLPAIAFALALAADSRRVVVRIAFVAAALGLTVALAATQSRGGLVAFGAALLLAPLIFWRHRLRGVVAIALVLAAAGGWFAASPHDWKRVTSFNDGGAGRSTLWLVAWRVAKDNSPVGVGLDSFRTVAPDYVQQPGPLRYVEQIDDPHVVHNTYLELLAETGIIGLGLFLAVVAACLGAARRAGRVFERLGYAGLARLSRAALLAAFAMLVSEVFQSNSYDPRLWVVFALGPALLTIASRTTARAPA